MFPNIMMLETGCEYKELADTCSEVSENAMLSDGKKMIAEEVKVCINL